VHKEHAIGNVRMLNDNLTCMRVCVGGGGGGIKAALGHFLREDLLTQVEKTPKYF